jgi:hypothetical protein
MDSAANLNSFSTPEEGGPVEENKKTLKLWLCELTHLTPQEVENLVDQMDQKNSLPQSLTQSPIGQIPMTPSI